MPLARRSTSVRRWTELRQDVLEHIQAKLRVAGATAAGLGSADTFRAALLKLPARKEKAATAEAARLAKLLQTNGFAWTWPSQSSNATHPSNGSVLPVIHVVDWWRAAKIRPLYDPTVTAWTRCSDSITYSHAAMTTFDPPLLSV